MSENDKKYVPAISNYMVKAVSQYRREKLETEAEGGLFRKNGDSTYATNVTPLGNVKYSMKKTAASPFGGTSLSSTVRTNFAGTGGTVRQVPEVYSPLWLNSNLNLPRDRATINAWCRSYFALNPIVQNAILLHSTYPISKINIKCKNPEVNDFFQAMIEEIDLLNVCVQIAQEYWTLGEAFVYSELDEKTAKWSRLLIQNPDYISVKRSVIAGEPIISLRPDENLKRICTSNRASDIQQRQQLDPSIIEHVRRGENIPLSNFYVTHLARKISPYEIRGTGLPVACFKQLMLFDKLRENKYYQADNMINPLTLVKIGGGSGEPFKPSPEDLEQYRQVFEESMYDKDFKIFTHDGVDVQFISKGQGIFGIGEDITQLIKEIYIGLLVPQVIMDGGGDVTYANGGVSLDVLRQRYMQFRSMLASFLKTKIFAPISRINDFYDYTNKEKKLIVPDVEWNHMSLFDMGDYIQNLNQLLSATPRNVSVHTVYRSLGLEYEEEVRKIRRETIDQVILIKEQEALTQMKLNDLRSIDDDTEIKEVVQAPLPGEKLPGMEAPPGTDLGLGGMGGGLGGGLGGGGGLGLGGMPPMGGPGGGLGGPPPPAGGAPPPPKV